jgi:phage recombination protein Bet
MTKQSNVAEIQQPEQPAKDTRKTLIGKIAMKYGVDTRKFWETLKATAFKQRNGQAPTDEQMMALLVVADQYGLNPFTKEIYAFPDQQNGIVPVVGVDGWSRIINSHDQFDGMEFKFSESTVNLDGLDKPVFEWIECIMYRKDRKRPTIIREYMDEIYRAPFKKNGGNGSYVIKGPWQTHPRRFARHKVLIQTARVALGYVGIYDQDEADRIIDSEAQEVMAKPSIEFDSEANQPQALPEPQQQQIMKDVNQIDSNVEYEVVNAVDGVNDVLNGQQEDLTQQETIDESQIVPIEGISQRDMKMIRQMLKFTIETSTWDTTRDNFKERYQGHTLEFALKELADAEEAFSSH